MPKSCKHLDGRKRAKPHSLVWQCQGTCNLYISLKCFLRAYKPYRVQGGLLVAPSIFYADRRKGEEISRAVSLPEGLQQRLQGKQPSLLLLRRPVWQGRRNPAYCGSFTSLGSLHGMGYLIGSTLCILHIALCTLIQKETHQYLQQLASSAYRRAAGQR